MIKRVFYNTKRGVIKIAFLIVFVILGSLALFVYLSHWDISEKIISSESENRQLVLARSAADSMEIFIRYLESHLTTLNKVDSVASLNEKESRPILEEFIDEFADTPLVGIAQFDKSGKAKVIANRSRMRTGEGGDFSDRPYFMWAKDLSNRDKKYLGDPFMSRAGISSGKMVISLATPVYYKDKFNGAIAMIVSFDDFSEKFIQPARIYKFGHVFIFDPEGKIIAGDNELLGENVLEYARNTKWDGWQDFVSKFEVMKLSKEGKTTWAYKHPTKDTEDTIVAYHKITIGSRELILAICSPKEKVLSGLMGFMMPHSNLLLFVIVASMFVVGLFLIVVEHLSHRDGYLRGFKEGVESVKSTKDKK